MNAVLYLICAALGLALDFFLMLFATALHRAVRHPQRVGGARFGRLLALVMFNLASGQMFWTFDLNARGVVLRAFNMPNEPRRRRVLPWIEHSAGETNNGQPYERCTLRWRGFAAEVAWLEPPKRRRRSFRLAFGAR